jgi:peptidoglycan/LPS O-acetylase OafA/YrhL
LTTSRNLQDPASPLAAARAYFPALDGLRAFAFLLVFATHYLDLPWGWTGVNIFFVLSGFLITGILYDTRDQPHRVWNFYLRRTLRIFPLYYGVILLLVLLYPIFRWQWNGHWLIWPLYLGNLLRYLTPRNAAFTLLEFAQPVGLAFPHVQLSFGHFWTLCVEEQFYLVWPCIVFLVKDRRNLMRLCLAGIVVLPLLRIVLSHWLPQSTLDSAVLMTATPLPFDALLMGAMAALLCRSAAAGEVLRCARVVLIALSVVFATWLGAYPTARHLTPAIPYPSGTFTWGLSLVDLYSVCLVLTAMDRSSFFFRLFNLRPLRWLGRISYGAYVFHDILHFQFLRLSQLHPSVGRWSIAALAFTTTLVAACASFRWFESPFIQLKDRWTRASSLRAEKIPEPVREVIQHVA